MSEDTALVPAEPTALQPAPSTAIAGTALPAYLQTGNAGPRGAEGLGANDIRLPRLTLCQAMTPQRKKSDPKYIPGLEEGEMFNDLTEERYGTGPLMFTVIRYLGKRGIEFAPADEGGGVIDPNVPLDDRRMQFTTDPDNPRVRVKPIATLFVEFLILLVKPNGELEPIALSMKGTQLKAANQLATLIKMSNVDSFAPLYLIKSVEQHKDQYTFSNFKIERAKVDNKPAWVDEQTYRAAESLFAQFKDKNIVIEHTAEEHLPEPGSDEEIPY